MKSVFFYLEKSRKLINFHVAKLFMKIMLKTHVNKARIKRTNQYRYGKNRNKFRVQLFQEFDEINKFLEEL